MTCTAAAALAATHLIIVSQIPTRARHHKSTMVVNDVDTHNYWGRARLGRGQGEGKGQGLLFLLPASELSTQVSFIRPFIFVIYYIIYRIHSTSQDEAWARSQRASVAQAGHKRPPMQN